VKSSKDTFFLCCISLSLWVFSSNWMREEGSKGESTHVRACRATEY
jgi:hypothetical protein